MLKNFCACIFLLFSLTFAYGNDSFILSNLDEAKKISQISGQPILVVFGADYCDFCNKLKKDILNFELSPAVDKYIICYLDVQKDKSLKKTYNIGAIPDSRILINNIEKSTNKGYSKNSYIKWISNVK
jgi:thioredoxin-related protein